MKNVAKHRHESRPLLDEDGYELLIRQFKIPFIFLLQSHRYLLHLTVKTQQICLKVKATYEDDEQLIVF